MNCRFVSKSWLEIMLEGFWFTFCFYSHFTMTISWIDWQYRGKVSGYNAAVQKKKSTFKCNQLVNLTTINELSSLHSVGYNIIFNKCSVSHTKVKSYSVLSNAYYLFSSNKRRRHDCCLWDKWFIIHGISCSTYTTELPGPPINTIKYVKAT